MLNQVRSINLNPNMVMQMDCILASGFGNADDVLSKGTCEVPQLKQGKKGQLLLEVHSCSLTPGDYRMLQGAAKFIKKPANGFPYIPGLDVSGTVRESTSDEFKVGDEVVSTWDMCGEGGMAECAIVDAARTVRRPNGVDKFEAAGLVNSAVHALKIVRKAEVKAGDKVIVLGGTGGVGSIVVQLCKMNGAQFVAATGTDTELLESIGVDQPIDYTKEKWEEVIKKPFDVVIDCAEGAVAWEKCRANGVLQANGIFVAVVLNEWDIHFTNPLGILGFMGKPLSRVLISWIRRASPSYRMYVDSPDKDDIAEVLKLVDEKKLRLVLHENRFFDFTEQGAKDAFNLLVSRRAHGKIIMKVSNK